MIFLSQSQKPMHSDWGWGIQPRQGRSLHWSYVLYIKQACHLHSWPCHHRDEWSHDRSLTLHYPLLTFSLCITHSWYLMSSFLSPLCFYPCSYFSLYSSFHHLLPPLNMTYLLASLILFFFHFLNFHSQLCSFSCILPSSLFLLP